MTPCWRRLLARALSAIADELDPERHRIVFPPPPPLSEAEIEDMKRRFFAKHGRHLP